MIAHLPHSSVILINVNLAPIDMILKALKRLNNLSLTTKIIIGLILGIGLGLVFRYNPLFFNNIGIEAKKFKILGDIFITLIQMIIAPLIFLSIASAILSSESPGKSGIMATKAIACFIVMTGFAVALGISAAIFFKPGANVDLSSTTPVVNHVYNAENSKTGLSAIGAFLIDIIPNNIFKALQSGNLIQIIFFAGLFAIAVMRIEESKGKQVIKMIDALSDTMYAFSTNIMEFSPFALFGITAWLIGTQDIALIRSLGSLVAIIYGACLTMIYVVYGLFALFVLRINPLHFYRKMGALQFTAYFLASSSGVLPKTLKVAQESLGISSEKARFIIPLGATMNMNGAAIQLGTAVVFASQLWNIDLDFASLIMIGILSVIGAIGTAPVPGSSILIYAGILSAMDLPLETVGIVLAVDRILDMIRTVTNVTGDMFSALIIDRLDNTFDKKLYES